MCGRKLIIAWYERHGSGFRCGPHVVQESDILALRLKQCLESDWTSQLTLLRMCLGSISPRVLVALSESEVGSHVFVKENVYGPMLHFHLSDSEAHLRALNLIRDIQSQSVGRPG